MDSAPPLVLTWSTPRYPPRTRHAANPPYQIYPLSNRFARQRLDEWPNDFPLYHTINITILGVPLAVPAPELPAPTAVAKRGVDFRFTIGICFAMLGGCIAAYAIPQDGGVVSLDRFAIRVVLVAAVVSAAGAFLSLGAHHVQQLAHNPTKRFAQPPCYINTRFGTMRFIGIGIISTCVMSAALGLLIFTGRVAWMNSPS